MQTIRDFKPGDRYAYDFSMCHYKKGWAQIDTSQDASYFGSWANPETLTILTYCEGDVTLQKADNEQEFVETIRQAQAWNDANGHTFKIDGMCSSSIIERFQAMGLGDLLH